MSSDCISSCERRASALFIEVIEIPMNYFCAVGAL